MKLILLEKVKNVGKEGSIVEVKSGYARNFLIPKGKAIVANKKNIEIQKVNQVELQKKSNQEILLAKSKVLKLQSFKKIVVYSQAGSKGKLFGSVGYSEVIDAMKIIGIETNKKELLFKNGNIHYLGVHTVLFKPHKEVFTEFLVEVLSN